MKSNENQSAPVSGPNVQSHPDLRAASEAPEIENPPGSPEGQGEAPCSVLSSSEPLTTDIWGEKITLSPDIKVYRDKENAEYVRYHRARQLPYQAWRQLILHQSDPVPTGLSSVKYSYYQDEDKVESHRLNASTQEGAYLQGQ